MQYDIGTVINLNDDLLLDDVLRIKNDGNIEELFDVSYGPNIVFSFSISYFVLVRLIVLCSLPILQFLVSIIWVIFQYGLINNKFTYH